MSSRGGLLESVQELRWVIPHPLAGMSSKSRQQDDVRSTTGAALIAARLVQVLFP